jgi:alpha 1,2-mannosyltransferase
MNSFGNKKYLIPVLLFFLILWCIRPSARVVSHSIVVNVQPAQENAAFVVLARNSDRKGIREAMQHLEDRFNHKYHYPYVFLNNEPFDQEFIDYTTGLASGETHYGLVDESMWGYPDWIKQHRARIVRQKMEDRGVIYGEVESYHHMCR